MSTAFSVTVIYLTKKYAATARSAVRMLAALTFPALLAAQPATLPLHAPANSMLNRLDILGLTRGQVHPELRPLCREDAVAQARLADSIDNGHLSDLDRADIHYIYDDNNEWLLPGDSTRLRRSAKPVLGAFFRTPANFFEVNTTEFRLRANPMLHLAWGTEQSASDPIFFNQRGIEVRGDVDGRVFFSTSLLESQVRLPNYVQRWAADYLAVPGSGFFKPYQSTPFGIENGYDFNLAQAYVGFRLSQHIDLRFGHGQHFIGNGYRSLFLSDAGSPTYFLQVNTRVWRLHYQNLFLELSPVSAAMPRPPNSLLPKKYVAAHYLNLRVSDNAAIGFFEATVFNRSGQFEWQYLNPVVLYRSVEGALGSPDNVLIGLDARWDLFKRLRLYGQFLLDEFFVSEAFGSARGGWWGNKFGFQAGLKYI
ncbi:MAG: hypothetical protein ACKVU2_10725, partial [Saprospiraceae bacterium]